jgi:hypothetical protein
MRKSNFGSIYYQPYQLKLASLTTNQLRAIGLYQACILIAGLAKSLLRRCIKLSKVVFPKPAGAEMSVTLRFNPADNFCSKRGRCTSSGRTSGM